MQESIPTSSFIDPAFTTSDGWDVELYLHFSWQTLTYVVCRPSEKKIFACVTYANIEDQLHFDQIFATDRLLASSYHTVKAMYGNALFTFVPEELYDPSSQTSYLHFNLAEPNAYFQEKNWLTGGAHNIFCVDRDPKMVVNKYFSQTNVFHSSTPLIAGLLHDLKEGKRILMFCANAAELEIAYATNGKLEFYNFFKTNTEEEFLYFALYTLQELGLAGRQIESAEMQAGGILDEKHHRFKTLKKYFPNIKPLSLPSDYTYSPDLKQTQSLSWSPVWLSLCE